MPQRVQVNPVQHPPPRDMIRPAVGADLDVVAAFGVAAIVQHIADVGFALFAECGEVVMTSHTVPQDTVLMATSNIRNCGLAGTGHLDPLICPFMRPDSHRQEAPP